MFVWSEAQAKQLLGVYSPDGGAEEAHDAQDNPEGAVGHAPGGTLEGQSLGTEEGTEGETGVWSNRRTWMGERLLDLGAGDGYVTKVLAKGATHVDVTETSPIMRRRLRGLGYRFDFQNV
ncbi:hypothetical protein Pcinc_029819 [Petrolisthes cinctipes]|uniref:Methyltransferase domain-containing protein n=1 Tax=Petrolisthes cinctipes TaxID=88211 RepID=A0AAE1EZ97_PETCI|nr:hypothetical protein Pcinc_029819 [Petrolisthes cinctipes]